MGIISFAGFDSRLCMAEERFIILAEGEGETRAEAVSNFFVYPGDYLSVLCLILKH
jgi:hypothetical protein